MDFDAEIIDITNLDEHPVINVGRPASKQKSANFGDGIELLMNEKRKNDGGSKNMGSDIDLADLNDLEAELNNLSEPSENIRTTHVKSKSSLFNQALNGNSSNSGNSNSNGAGTNSFPIMKFNYDKEVNEYKNLNVNQFIKLILMILIVAY